MTDFTCCDVSKGQRESIRMKPWCKRKSAVFIIEISSDDLITKLVQNIPATSADSDVVICYELLGNWICVIFEIFICS